MFLILLAQDPAAPRGGGDFASHRDLLWTFRSRLFFHDKPYVVHYVGNLFSLSTFLIIEISVFVSRSSSRGSPYRTPTRPLVVLPPLDLAPLYPPRVDVVACVCTVFIC